jgi:hypothetical protein
VAFVPQEPVIVDATIADNIRFFRPWIDEAAIREAAQAAHIADEIEQLPEGYASPLSGMSVALSGGVTGTGRNPNCRNSVSGPFRTVSIVVWVTETPALSRVVRVTRTPAESWTEML